MKSFKPLAALLVLCLLGACTNTIQGASKDADDITDWAHNKPSTTGTFIGEAPRGYTARELTPIGKMEARQKVEAEADQALLKPVERQEPETAGGLHKWRRDGGYSLEDAEQEADQDQVYASSGDGLHYNGSVQVFPIDGDNSPYESLRAVNGGYDGDISGINAPDSKDLAQQVFFAHGSAAIGRGDRKALGELASSLSANGKDYNVAVTGHASKRVNTTKDPVARKMINFKMAQKRADAVAGQMFKSGIAPSLVSVSSAGDEEAERKINGKTAEASARRVDVFVAAQ